MIDITKTMQNNMKSISVIFMVVTVVIFAVSKAFFISAAIATPSSNEKLNASFIPIHWTDSTTGFAIGGFDPVSYFEAKKIEQGREEFQFLWHGVSWCFANTGNLSAFKRAPALYVPRFAGYDAYALSNGILTEGHPAIWQIYEGRLYLFHNEANRYLWQNNAKKIMMKTISNWQRLSLILPKHKILEKKE